MQTVALSEAAWRLFPTPATYYLNRVKVQELDPVASVPAADWSRRERRQLLASSEERLRNIEGKGPGLATVSAVVVAVVLVATTSGWEESTAFGRILLGAAAFYTFFSTLMPLYLVGPLARSTIHTPELEAAAAACVGDEAEETADELLAARAASAAAENDLRNRRFGNLLDASRRELFYAFALVMLWALLVPVSGALQR
jgi:hypothetical protein